MRTLMLLASCLAVIACDNSVAAPTARLQLALPSTNVATRSIVVRVTHDTSMRLASTRIVFDEGTDAAQEIQPSGCEGFVGPYAWCTDDLTWPIAPRRPLPNGRHTLSVTLRDSSGVEAHQTATFTTTVPDILYSPVLLTSATAVDGEALDVNVNGLSVGWIDLGAGPRAATWTSDGTLTLLDAVPSRAVAVNVGGAAVGTVDTLPALWSGGARRILAATQAEAVDINASGVVLMSVYPQTASLWENGTVTVLPNCSGVTHFSSRNDCWGAFINDAGQVIVRTTLSHAHEEWFDGRGVTVSLPDAPTFSGFYHAVPGGFNAGGRYAGWTWGTTGALLLGGGSDSARLLVAEFGFVNETNRVAVRGLNDADDLLVFDSTAHEAFLLRNGRVLHVKLTSTDLQLESVNAIGNGGQIVGRARSTTTNATSAVLLKPAG